jgi:hypothetical protein
MGLFSGVKVLFGSVLGIIVLALWFFGGIIGAFVGIAKGEALYAVLSLIIPAFGAIYTIVSAIGALF